MKIYAIETKGMRKDGNGLPQYFWATSGQVKKLDRIINNPDFANQMVKIGNDRMRISEIVKILEKDAESSMAPASVLRLAEAETKALTKKGE